MESKNYFEEFLNNNPELQKKMDLISTDPIVEMVDSAIQEWTAKKRDKIFEFTPERRELLIKVVKMATKYQDIDDSPFYQYIKAYILHLYYWLEELQRMEVSLGNQRKIHYLGIFDEVVSEAFRLGFALRGIEPPK